MKATKPVYISPANAQHLIRWKEYKEAERTASEVIRNTSLDSQR